MARINGQVLTPRPTGMTLQKAIEINADSAFGGITTFDQDFKDAQKILIEAGKRLKQLRRFSIRGTLALLEGETPE